MGREGSNFSGASPKLRTNRLTQNDQICGGNTCAEGRASGSQSRPYVKGRVPASPNFWDSYICLHGLTQSNQILYGNTCEKKREGVSLSPD